MLKTVSPTSDFHPALLLKLLRKTLPPFGLDQYWTGALPSSETDWAGSNHFIPFVAPCSTEARALPVMQETPTE